MILTVTLSLLLSAEPSFSLGVLAASVGVDCTLELGWDDLFSVSVLISGSVSCCVAVAKIKEKREWGHYSWEPVHSPSSVSHLHMKHWVTVDPSTHPNSPSCVRGIITWLRARFHMLRPVSLLAGVVTVAGIPTAIKDGLFLAVGTPLLLLSLIHCLLLFQFQLLLHLSNQTISFLFQALAHFSHCQFYSKSRERWVCIFHPTTARSKTVHIPKFKDNMKLQLAVKVFPEFGHLFHTYSTNASLPSSFLILAP